MSEPDTDNLLPKGGEFFGIPTEDIEQTQSRETEKAKVFNALPLMTDILARFDERITFYSSIDSIDSSLLTDPEAFMHTVTANKLTVQNLTAEKNYLEGLLEEYVR